ncbi:uncharacterized protein LOC118193417 isoform X3 [Stegodyphus dumicola]|uniref:uncharacterized protein LOC118193417 isoform X3 n=1 Tax=Stegodyphus dumicola TaxID=202533 RepID=UPI0015ACE941|nr:uncharacterized protein LOC118193417 isoform X3 [Stegodyphus dumicola]
MEPKEEVMHRLELKRVAKFFRRSSAVDEKTPLTRKTNTVTDNGTIAKDLKMNKLPDGTANSYENFPDGANCEKESENSNQMSILRKICFFLSLNVGVLYVVVLAWILPCRESICFSAQKDWELNLTNALLTTDLKIIREANVPSMVIFGFADDTGGNIIEITMSNGEISWNRSLEFIPRQVFCNYDKTSRNGGDSSPDCIVTGYNIMIAFSALNGSTIWQHNLSLQDGEFIYDVFQKNDAYLLTLSDQYISIFDVYNGSQISATVIPCIFPNDVRLSPPLSGDNSSQWILICAYGDRIEVWTFEEQELLNFGGSGGWTEEVKFSLLFSQESSSGSMDLACDVTMTPDYLALSWANIVVMVTLQAPFHQLRKSWERRFLDPYGYHPSVTCIVNGSFTDASNNEIAAAVQQGSNVTIHILDCLNGSSIVSTGLGTGRVLSMKALKKVKDQTDALLVEMDFPESSNASDAQTSRTYHLVQYEGHDASVRILVTSGAVFYSVINTSAEGVADLLLVSRTENGDTILKRHFINREDILCHVKELSSITVFL